MLKIKFLNLKIWTLIVWPSPILEKLIKDDMLFVKTCKALSKFFLKTNWVDICKLLFKNIN